ncbi:S-layer homology domain-containing protein [Bacillus sp. S13(2024)]|uniref:S-layer homology domain-containing protein n=1 Tax=unclassified Bacillus (in: firmicutes) TaxID=185979 RepID=UPI003D257228
MKRLSKGVTAFMLTGSLLLSPAASYAATDDITGHMFEKQMRGLIDRGIMSGYGNNIYLPDKNVSRAEFATLIAKALQLPKADSNFTDVPTSYGLYEGVSKAAAANIISGRGNNTFGPDDNITREEMAVMVRNALAYKKINIPLSPLTFTDLAQIVYPEHVRVVVAAGIIKGYPEDRTFRPKLPATRGTAAAFLSGMIQAIENNGSTIPSEAKPYVITNVKVDGNEQEIGRYSSYEEAVAGAQSQGVNAVKYNGQFIWVQAGYAVAKKTSGNTINIYGENLQKVVTYVQYGTEFKVLGVEGDRVKVQLSDLNGYYVKKDEVTLIPTNQMKESYYYVSAEDGYLYHKYYDYYASKPKYTEYRYGKAPSSMKPEQKVYSIDGKTFGNETFYQYFNYVSLRTKTAYTAEELDNYIKKDHPDSPLIGLGKKFKEVESKYNVNALFLYSLAVHESLYGTSQLAKEKNNLFGLRATDDSPFGNGETFNSKEDCIEHAAKVYMNEGYLNPGHWRYTATYTGNKAGGVNMKYASDPYWGEKVAGHMFRFDTYLGKKDYNKYKLARITNGADVTNNANEKLYHVGNGTIVTVTGEETINGQAWLKVVSDDPTVNEGYIAKENAEYVNQ